MNIRISHLVVGSLLTLSMITGGSVAANASTPPPNTAATSNSALELISAVSSQTEPDATTENASEALEKSTEILFAAMTTSVDGAKTFDFEQAVAGGSTTEQAEDFATGFAYAGGSVINSPGDVALVDPSANETMDLRSAVQAQALCTGRTQQWQDLWGSHFEINSCTTQQVVGLLGIGAGAEALVGVVAAAFAVPVAGWIAAGVVAIIGIGAGAVTYCAATGTGITLHFTGAPWCGAQTL